MKISICNSGDSSALYWKLKCHTTNAQILEKKILISTFIKLWIFSYFLAFVKFPIFFFKLFSFLFFTIFKLVFYHVYLCTLIIFSVSFYCLIKLSFSTASSFHWFTEFEKNLIFFTFFRDTQRNKRTNSIMK